MFSVGVTGGIGSGKSTVCRVFQTLGIQVYLSDIKAKTLMNENEDLRSEIIALLGRDIYLSDGSIDREQMASLIFNDARLLDRVNSLVHPYVFADFDKWADCQDSDYVILESAILFESNACDKVNRIITVTAPEQERIARVMQRNLLSREQVMERIHNQITEEEMVKQSDYIIQNADNQMIIPEVLRIHSEIMDLINDKK